MQWLPRSASESAFPSMIDTYFGAQLMLAECGPSKTWVIIQEVSKVISGNEATRWLHSLHSVLGSSYAKHYNKRIDDARRDRTGDM